MHNTPPTTLEKLRTSDADAYGAEARVFGRPESAGEARAVLYPPPRGRLTLTTLTILSAEQADMLAAHLAGLGHTFSGVTSDHDTATAFAGAWKRHTGAAPVRDRRPLLDRLGTLTPPEPVPQGGVRLVDEGDHERVMRCTFWEIPDGMPVAMAGANPMVAGMLRIGYVPVADFTGYDLSPSGCGGS
ncbi:hypothetical protein AB0N07_29300 [Streptomyces sp. NPDC051172]|uniref:hypothetical protein n=1 Tax=Streptomyces sp. NPDC051172 TaxID=3155796 RepID=UPI003439FCD9